MLRKLAAVCLLLCLLLGCAPAEEPRQQVYEATFLDVFDTVTTLKGPAESKETFSEISESVRRELAHYHRLFDVYQDYEGVNNLKTVNDNAGVGPVAVEGAVLDLLEDCIRYYGLTDGRVNVAMGSVLKLWHEARNDGLDDPANAYLPDPEKLAEAAASMDIESIVIDREASTVYISDPNVRLDVGAIAKGWAAQRVAERAPAGLLLSVGGNVCATGPKYPDTPWVIGVRDPRGSASDYLHTLYVSGGSIVTSGDYQRCYMVDGKLYHHIIDPDTQMPSEYWSSVTVICTDSGLADALSTALFLLPLEAGQTLLDKTGAEAMWVDGQGNCFYSPGFEENIRT